MKGHETMFTISNYTIEQIHDPFAILTGERYEFKLSIEVDEDDELFSENGLFLRVIYRVDEASQGIVKYEIYETTTEHYLDFDLEADEVAMVAAFCKSCLKL